MAVARAGTAPDPLPALQNSPTQPVESCNSKGTSGGWFPRDVIASLWKVPDVPTAALMAEFYRNLWERNLSPMESLRQAQLTIYRNPGKIAELAAGFRAGFKEVKGDETVIKPTADGKAHPKQWAAFTLSGPGR